MYGFRACLGKGPRDTGAREYGYKGKNADVARQKI